MAAKSTGWDDQPRATCSPKQSSPSAWPPGRVATDRHKHGAENEGRAQPSATTSTEYPDDASRYTTTIERMSDALFASWPEAFPDKPARTQVHPPKLVFVELGAILPHDPNATRSTVLRIRAACLDLTGTTPGELLAWARLTDATWIALVRFTATTGSRRGSLPMCQWVPAASVRRGDARQYLASASQQTFHRCGP